MRNRILLTPLLLCLISAPAIADSNVTSTVAGILYLHAGSPGTAPVTATLVFVATSLPAGTEGCPAHTPMNMVYLDMSDTQAPTLYAALLSGYLSGQSMQIGIRGCNSSGVPKVYSVLAGHLLAEYDGTGALMEETVWLGDMPGPPGLGTCARVLERPPRRRDLIARRAPLTPVTSVGFRVARSQAQEMLASSSLRRVGFEASLELAVVDADHALRRWRLEYAPRER